MKLPCMSDSSFMNTEIPWQIHVCDSEDSIYCPFHSGCSLAKEVSRRKEQERILAAISYVSLYQNVT